MNKLNLFGVLLICLTMFVACGDEDDNGVLPDSALSIYTGELVYTSATGLIITNLNGTATIDLSGSQYIIQFSDDVPAISGVTFIESNGSYTTASGTAVTGINIAGDALSIGSTQDGNTWAFEGTK